MLRVLVSLLFFGSLTAPAQHIFLEPAGPTSRTPVEARLYVVCDPLSYTLARVGNVLKIHVTQGPGEGLCDPPIASQLRVPLGTLATGEYRIEVMVGELDSIAASRTFVVRNGAGGAFEIRPFAVPTQPFGLWLRLDTGDLGVARVFVDDVEATDLHVNGAYWFPAPTHARGFADIEPYYAEVDLPQGMIGERVNVEVVMPLDATGWAFAAVTNNETQQVTIVAPQ